MRKNFQELLLKAIETEPVFLARAIEQSKTEDVFIQLGDFCALVMKGEFYSEHDGRIVQLMALNDGKLDFGGKTYQIESARVSETAYFHYDFVLVNTSDTQDRHELLLEYATVRKMVERKTAVLDLTEDNKLLQDLNDMHEDAFIINGKAFYIAGEQWTQSKPGHRDLMLIPVGDTRAPQVIKTVPEALIRDLIQSGRTSFDLD